MGEHASKSCKQDRTKKVWNLCQNMVFRRIRCRFTFLSFWVWLQFLPGADTLHGNSYPKLIESLMPPFFSGMILVYPQYILVYPNHKVESNNGYCCEPLNQPTNRTGDQSRGSYFVHRCTGSKSAMTDWSCDRRQWRRATAPWVLPSWGTYGRRSRFLLG
jgi:hypothetical protein